MAIPCSGVILAGGQSKRFEGRNKAYLRIGGVRIMDRILKLYSRLFDQIVLVTNDPTDYLEVDALIVSDHYEVRSSLNGLHAGLFAAANEYAFFMACDTPFAKESMIRCILDRIEQKADIVIPSTSAGYEPMFAVYRKNCLPAMEWQLENELLKIQGLFRKVRVKTVDETLLRKADPELISFFNINTPKDLKRAEALRITMEEEYMQKMNTDRLIAKIKQHPDYQQVGMILCHNGVVRCTSRDGRPVTGLRVAADLKRLEKVLAEQRSRPGIVDIQVEIAADKDLVVGDDVMLLVVAGDIRENVLEVLSDTLNAIKSTVTAKTEYFA
jgi:molybdopterin-guanine dinucleotide biosynthesis protein A